MTPEQYDVVLEAAKKAQAAGWKITPFVTCRKPLCCPMAAFAIDNNIDVPLVGLTEETADILECKIAEMQSFMCGFDQIVTQTYKTAHPAWFEAGQRMRKELLP